jgi:DNA-binding response OmpR family regulator
VTFAQRRTAKEIQKRHVMLVENDKGAADVVAWILSQNHFPVKRFSEPGKALKEFRKNQERYGVIIVDARIPGMTGFEFARRTRKISTEVRIVLLTDFQITKSEFGKVFPSTQIDDIVVKPTAPEKLMQAVTGVDAPRHNDNSVGNGGRQDYQSAVF